MGSSLPLKSMSWLGSGREIPSSNAVVSSGTTLFLLQKGMYAPLPLLARILGLHLLPNLL